jgi:hypothetical protein
MGKNCRIGFSITPILLDERRAVWPLGNPGGNGNRGALISHSRAGSRRPRGLSLLRILQSRDQLLR